MPRKITKRAWGSTPTEFSMISHDVIFSVRIAAVPSCRPRTLVADSGEILAYDSRLYQGLECADLFRYGTEPSRLKNTCQSSGGFEMQHDVDVLLSVWPGSASAGLRAVEKLTISRLSRFTHQSICLPLRCTVRMRIRMVSCPLFVGINFRMSGERIGPVL